MVKKKTIKKKTKSKNGKKLVCKVCKKLLKQGIISYEGKKFCCRACINKFKKSEKKKLCEFC